MNPASTTVLHPHHSCVSSHSHLLRSPTGRQEFVRRSSSGGERNAPPPEGGNSGLAWPLVLSSARLPDDRPGLLVMAGACQLKKASAGVRLSPFIRQVAGGVLRCARRTRAARSSLPTRRPARLRPAPSHGPGRCRRCHRRRSSLNHRPGCAVGLAAFAFAFAFAATTTPAEQRGNSRFSLAERETNNSRTRH